MSLLWQKLSGIRSLEFEAISNNDQGGWNGQGAGQVITEIEPNQVLIFNESGNWSTAEGKSIAFSNCYRWTALAKRAMLLEHLRYGKHRPVVLFELSTNDDINWYSSAPHLCNSDRYSAKVSLSDDCIEMQWEIIGKVKNERIYYRYYCSIS